MVIRYFCDVCDDEIGADEELNFSHGVCDVCGRIICDECVYEPEEWGVDTICVECAEK